MKKRKIAKSLPKEYVRHWYVILLGILFMFPAYAMLPMVLSFCMAKGLGAFAAGIISIAASGFVATLPMLVLNIKLAFRGKPYALAVQFIIFDVLGTAFYVINRVIMN